MGGGVRMGVVSARHIVWSKLAVVPAAQRVQKSALAADIEFPTQIVQA